MCVVVTTDHATSGYCPVSAGHAPGPRTGQRSGSDPAHGLAELGEVPV